jgi:RNA recognition motif-containing protein
MATKLYVGGLAYSVTDQELEAMFAEHGQVVSAAVIKDRDTGRSKGFGFVEFSDDTAAQNAIKALNGKEVGGRSLTVNEARPQEDRPRFGGGNGGGGNNFRKSY